MPYVTQDRRDRLDTGAQIEDPGELNYAITRLVTAYLGSRPNYRRYNDAVGALESAKLELYRRLIAPYENQKQHDNGDVY